MKEPIRTAFGDLYIFDGTEGMSDKDIREALQLFPIDMHPCSKCGVYSMDNDSHVCPQHLLSLTGGK